MRVQDYIIERTRKSAEQAFKYARNVPADKLDWSPLGEGRSVLSQCREMAKSPDWAVELINPDPNKAEVSMEESMELFNKESASWTDAEICYKVCQEKLEKFFELVRNFPDGKLKETKWLPYDGGKDFTLTEILEYPQWNFDYHQGQIAYIQTLYGDKTMP